MKYIISALVLFSIVACAGQKVSKNLVKDRYRKYIDHRVSEFDKAGFLFSCYDAPKWKTKNRYRTISNDCFLKYSENISVESQSKWDVILQEVDHCTYTRFYDEFKNDFSLSGLNRKEEQACAEIASQFSKLKYKF